VRTHDSLTSALKTPMRVLIIEDEDRYRNVLMDVLPEMNCEPISAASAMEAMDILESETPDAVLLDLNLPVMDGMAFLERFRRAHQETPVIILTGVGDLPAAQRAIRFGVTDFLTKPCPLSRIEAALDRARRAMARPTTPTEREHAEPPSRPPRPRSIAEIERDAIRDALRRHRGNRSAAAAELGISRRTLYNRLARYDVELQAPNPESRRP